MQQATLIDLPEHGHKRIAAKCPPGVSPGVVKFRWPASVRQIWRRPKILPPSVWAEKYRIMEAERPRPGPWNNNFARYACGIMDAFFLPYVREIVVVAPPQTAKTEIMLNCLGAAMDQAPGPALLVYDQQDVAKNMSIKRVRSMVELSPTLKRQLTGLADDLGNYEIRLRHTHMAFAWATSVSQLANRSFRYLFLDEVDKYENTSKREAGPVSRARLRTRSYKYTSKTMLSSSPTIAEGEITIAFSRVQARFRYAVVCPDCGVSHVMQFSGPKVDGKKTGVVWPEDERDAQRIEALNLARYVCPHCFGEDKGGWDDFKRDRIVSSRSSYWQEETTGLDLVTYMNRYRVLFHQ